MKPKKKWVQYPNLSDQDLINIQRLCLNHFNALWEIPWIKKMNSGEAEISRDVAISIIAYCDIKQEPHMTKDEVIAEAEKLYNYKFNPVENETKGFRIKPVPSGCYVRDGDQEIMITPQRLQQIIDLAKERGWFKKPPVPAKERETAMVVHADLR